jgi:hypothetical protein
MRRRRLKAAFKLLRELWLRLVSQSATARRSPSSPEPTTDPVPLVDAQAMVGSFVPSRPAQPSNAASSGRTGRFCAGAVVVARRPSVEVKQIEAAQSFPPSSCIEEGCGCELVLGRGGMTSGTVVARTRYRVTRGGTNFPTMQSARGKWRVQAGVYRHRDGAGRPQRDSRCSTRASTNFPTIQPQLVAAVPLECHFSAPEHGPDRRHGCSPQRARRHKPSHHAAVPWRVASAGGLFVRARARLDSQ